MTIIFTRMSDLVRSYIETLIIENTSSEQFQKIITLYSNVLLSPVLYRDAPNSKWKLVANSNDNNYIKDVRLSPVIYRDAPN